MHIHVARSSYFIALSNRLPVTNTIFCFAPFFALHTRFCASKNVFFSWFWLTEMGPSWHLGGRHLIDFHRQPKKKKNNNIEVFVFFAWCSATKRSSKQMILSDLSLGSLRLHFTFIWNVFLLILVFNFNRSIQLDMKAFNQQSTAWSKKKKHQPNKATVTKLIYENAAAFCVWYDDHKKCMKKECRECVWFLFPNRACLFHSDKINAIRNKFGWVRKRERERKKDRMVFERHAQLMAERIVWNTIAKSMEIDFPPLSFDVVVVIRAYTNHRFQFDHWWISIEFCVGNYLVE